MSLRINTNVSALNAYQNLSKNQNDLSNSIEKLSSGLRINKAADDAAGLSISQGLTSQINGLSQAVSNAQDGINVAQIADGALGTTQQILQRMRTLVVQASNSGTQDANSLNAIGAEITSLNSQLDNIGNQTKFGQTALLDGTYNGTFQVGANNGDTVNLDLSTGLSGGISASGLALSGLTIASTGFTSGALYSGTSADLQAIDSAIKSVSSARSGIGATQNQLNYTVSNLQTAITNVTASRSNLTDADLAVEVSKMTQSQILSQAATSVLAQANSAPQSILKLLQ
ncbi:MAG: flagellin [Pseudonocardiales bacterium]|jgi:flagellin|nr:flagellin [Pseudonocardiales bacterium]